jgi:mono/diheme cytochrome c family protein
MERSLILLLGALLSAPFVNADDAAIARGKLTFATYCAPCHGVKGAGLVGPNLTDAEVLHGESFDEVVTVITQGVMAKAMPAWASVLTPAQIADTAHYVKSIMGQNLAGPARGAESTVTPFPTGSLTLPYVLRTFMPTLDVGPEVFAHHGEGHSTFKYSATAGTVDKETVQNPIAGVPGAIAVSFGPRLSYCFDTTECRLLYVWSGPFVDMTYYWGEGSGGARKSFDYIARVIGDVSFQTSGPPPLAGDPQFGGYRKVLGVPEFMYRIGSVDFTLRIEPGDAPEDVLLHYTAHAPGSGGLTLQFSPAEASRLTTSAGQFKGNQLVLTAAEAAAFTLRLSSSVASR